MARTVGTNEIHNHALEASAAATGRTLYRAIKDHTIQDVLDDIRDYRHTQYSASDPPSGDPQSGYHEINVNVSRTGVTVRTRNGHLFAATGN